MFKYIVLAILFDAVKGADAPMKEIPQQPFKLYDTWQECNEYLRQAPISVNHNGHVYLFVCRRVEVI